VKSGNRPGRLKQIETGLNQVPILIGLTVLLSLVLCSAVGYWIVSTGDNPIFAVPISLHSVLVANYQADPRLMKIPPVQLSLIQDALEDQSIHRSNGGLATLIISLFTPVPTLTPIFSPSSAPTALAPNQTPVITATPRLIYIPSATPTWTQTPTATIPASTLTPTRSLPGGTPTTTLRYSSTPTPTTLVVTVSTRTYTPSPTPTNTPAPPISTPRPTDTPDPYPPPSLPVPSPYP